MSLKLRVIKKGMKDGGKSKVANYTPPRFLYRDANEYTELPIKPKTLDLVPKKLKEEISDLDFIGVIKSEFPNRKKPKGSKSKQVGPSYRVVIKFENVKFSDAKDTMHTEEIEFKGKKLYFKKPTLAKNSAKIRCQCFTGDTLIPLPSGKAVPIQELVGKEFSVYSFNETTKKIEIAKATNCEAKREDVIYHVELDNGNVIKCTGDHKFLTRSGEWVEARDLEAGCSLEPLYRRESTKLDDAGRQGYEMVYQTHYATDEFTHVLSDDYNMKNDLQKTNQGKVRHHIDFNKLNNSPNNILRMDWLDHFRLHHDKMIGDGNPMRNKKSLDKMLNTRKLNGEFEKSSERMKTNNPMFNRETVLKTVDTHRKNGTYKGIESNFKQSSPEVRRKMSEAKKGKTSPNFEKMQAGCRKLIAEGKHNTQVTKIRRGLFSWLGELKNGNIHISNEILIVRLGYKTTCGGLNAIKTAITQLDGFHFDRANRLLIKNDTKYNHKVISVKKTDKSEITYCFTVEGNHNFAIDVGDGGRFSSGIIVHNCSDFVHKFAFPIAKAGALAFGTPLGYVRKTPKPTAANYKKWEDDPQNNKKPYPFANPTDKLGYCKHIHSFLAYLIDDAKLVKQS